MINYSRQLTICHSLRETLRKAIIQSDDASIRSKANEIPTNESILRAVSIVPEIDIEEKLRDFIIAHILNSLRLTPIQKEHLLS